MLDQTAAPSGAVVCSGKNTGETENPALPRSGYPRGTLSNPLPAMTPPNPSPAALISKIKSHYNFMKRTKPHGSFMYRIYGWHHIRNFFHRLPCLIKHRELHLPTRHCFSKVLNDGNYQIVCNRCGKTIGYHHNDSFSPLP